MIIGKVWTDEERFEKAKKVTIAEYDGPIFRDGTGGDWGEGYFSDIDALLDHCESNGEDPPSYVWACSPKPFELGERAVEDFLERELESQEMYEGAGDHITAEQRKELSDILEAWAKKVNLQSWEIDYSRAVLLEEPAEEPAPNGN